MIKTTDVFGVKNELVKSYINREKVDGNFIKALDEGKHIVVYGASKQGKSSLIKKNLDEKDFITVNCDINSKTSDIYRTLIRNVNKRVEKYIEISENQGKGASVGVKAGIRIWGLGKGEAEVKADLKSESSETQYFENIEYNLEIANDICDLLEKNNFKKNIILENFHYLNNDVQKKLAYDLRTFHDKGIRFIILGIWREKNRLTQFNGELSDRITEIPVEPWQNQDFEEVIKIGSLELNIEITKNLKTQIFDLSYGSIGIVQELLKNLCLNNKIEMKQETKKTILNQNYLEEAIETKRRDYTTRHLKALEDMANYSADSKLYLPYYFIRILLEIEVDKLCQGISRDYITDKILEIHNAKESVKKGDITTFLRKITLIQEKCSISPFLFDYDDSLRVIRVIDPSLLFYLNYINVEEVLEEIIDPRN